MSILERSLPISEEKKAAIKKPNTIANLRTLRNVGLIMFIASLTSASCDAHDPLQTLTPQPDNTLEIVPTETPFPTATVTLTPTPTRTPTPEPSPTFTPTPNIRETQAVEWENMLNAEMGEEVSITNPLVERIIRFQLPTTDRLGIKDAYSVEVTVPGARQKITLWQSDCIYEALRESGQLGSEVMPGVWEPGAVIDHITGRVKMSRNVAMGMLLDALGIGTPIVDLDEVINDGVSYECEVVTTAEGAVITAREMLDALRSYLDRIRQE
jgi:hypothetical protein